jgi:hypothetical protein
MLSSPASEIRLAAPANPLAFTSRFYSSFKTMYRDEHGVWNGVCWNGQLASFFALCETDEKKALAKLLGENAECA